METEAAPVRGEQPTEPAPTQAPEAGRSVSLVLETVRGREAFLKLQKEWDAAVASGPDRSPALQHDFLRLWLENFAPSDKPVTVVARRERKIAAALGINLKTGTIDGVPVRLAEGWCNPHSTRGGLVLGKEGLAGIDSVARRVLDEPWDVMTLRDVPAEGGILESVAQAFKDEGCTVSFESPMESPYVPLPASFEELEKRIDSKFRANLRRRRRRLEEQGPVTFEVVTGGDALDGALEDALAIEAGGWKGEEGSAIRARPETVGFYAGWARLLAREKKLRLCFLKVGEERVAFHFAYVAGGRYYLPKCGFDEKYYEQSPGQLLMVEVLRHCIGEKLESFEFLGFSMPWKRDWTPLVRPHACLVVYRPTLRGKAARLVRGEVRPRVGRLVKRVKAEIDARRRVK